MKIGIKSEKVIPVQVIDQELADAYAALITLLDESVDLKVARSHIELGRHHEIVRLVASKLASGSTNAGLQATLKGVKVLRGKPQFLASHVQFAQSGVKILDSRPETRSLAIKELITMARRSEAVGGKGEVQALLDSVDTLEALEAVAPPLAPKGKGREPGDKPKFKTATELVEWAVDQMTKYDDIEVTNDAALAKLSGILAMVAARHRKGERKIA